MFFDTNKIFQNFYVIWSVISVLVFSEFIYFFVIYYIDLHKLQGHKVYNLCF